MIKMEKIKSDLQKRLEAQGWEFLTNTDPRVETVYHPVYGKGKK